MVNEFVTKRVAKATFDATGGLGIATHKLDMFIPSGAIVTKVFYNVRTTFTSATDAATLAISIQSAGDVKAAIAISAAGDVYDAGVRSGLPGHYALDGNALTAIAMAAAEAGSAILTTAVRQPTIAVAVEALTAGVLDLYVEYII